MMLQYRCSNVQCIKVSCSYFTKLRLPIIIFYNLDKKMIHVAFVVGAQYLSETPSSMFQSVKDSLADTLGNQHRSFWVFGICIHCSYTMKGS